jgi:uncharacterized protein (TIGR03435 family)
MVFLAGALSAQETPAKFSFEVASVRLAPPEERLPGGAKYTGIVPPLSGDSDHITITHASLRGLLLRAYDLQFSQLVGPDWLDDGPDGPRFNITAKAPDDAPKGHIPEMLQSLLAERFGVKTHWESKDAKGYALLVAANGLKLKQSVPNSSGVVEKSRTVTMSGQFTWKGETFGEFAQALTGLLGTPVADMTGLPGAYDISLEAAPDSMPGLHSRTAASDSSYPSIFTALKSLGLTLEAKEVPVKQLVVDAARKLPTEN